LCNRQPFPAEYAAAPLYSHPPALDFVLDLALRLPPLLASADQITTLAVRENSTHGNVLHDLAKVVRQLLALKKMLDSWFHSFCKPADQIEGESGSALQLWRSLPDVTSESLCRICLLLIHQTLSDLHSSHNSDTVSQVYARQLAAACAEDLYHTTLLLSKVAERPVSKAIATRAPLHFLCRYYRSVSDKPRLERCYEMIENIRAEAPYLNWEMLLPWSLLPLTSVRGAGGPLIVHPPVTPFSETAVDDSDSSPVDLPLNVIQEYASAFARCLREAVGITDEQTSLLVASDSMIADTLQTYASMLGSLPGTQHHTAVKFVHRQRK
jgi:hypothetical protein